MIPLPVDEILPSLLSTLEGSPIVLLTAEPGAGKTTRVPPFLARSPLYAGKQIWVLEPRRIAAYVAAARVAEEDGSAPGEFSGWHFRFERREKDSTRVLFLTEGMFLRRLQANPRLEGVAAVILDEFHERSLDADLSLALLRRLQKDRPDLRLLIMSATIDAGGISEKLGKAPAIHCPGRTFPIEYRYLEKDRSDPKEFVEAKVSRGLRLLEGVEGDWLVFLPGTGEIRRCAEKLHLHEAAKGRVVLQLHGSLSADEQRRVLAPSDKPKIILATSVAETSLTVPGVRAVLDAGLSRRDVFNHWSGLSALVTQPSTQASMDQRAGRAGREAPGVAVRLCSAAEYQARARFDEPELARADLAPAALQALSAGYPPLEKLDWLEAPSPARLQAAQTTLEDLGAVDSLGITARGRLLARAPLHPRLAATAMDCRAEGPEEEGKLLKALLLLSEERARHLDFPTAVARYEPQGQARKLGDQLKDWIASIEWRSLREGSFDERLSLALLRAFPDQVALAKKGSDKRGETKFALASGGEAIARDEQMRLEPGYYLILELLEQKNVQGQGFVPKALSVLPLREDWLLEGNPRLLRDEVKVSFNEEAQRAEAESRLRYGELTLSQGPATHAEALKKAGELLMERARKAGLSAFCPEGQPGRYLARRAYSGLDLPGEEEMWKLLGQAATGGALSFSQLKSLDVLARVLDQAGPDARRRLEMLAPKSIKLPSGREASIHYEEGKPPYVASRMQDFFGLSTTPGVAGKPLAVHLLAPNGRAQQITTDLGGFWEREYPRIRKELMRKYPRHAWPEDPLKP